MVNGFFAEKKKRMIFFVSFAGVVGVYIFLLFGGGNVECCIWWKKWVNLIGRYLKEAGFFDSRGALDLILVSCKEILPDSHGRAPSTFGCYIIKKKRVATIMNVLNLYVMVLWLRKLEYIK